MNTIYGCDSIQGPVDITFFVACYNEENGIIPSLEAIRRAVALANVTHDVIVIDDGSRDKSVELIQQYKKENPEQPVVLVVNQKNRGLASNYVDAAFLGKGRYFRLVSGDDVEPAENIAVHLGLLGKAGMLLTDPVVVTGKSPLRKCISRLFVALVNSIAGFRLPYWNGPVTHLRENVLRWHSCSRGFGYQAELVHMLLVEGESFHISEGHFHEREAGQATALTLKNLWSVFCSLCLIAAHRIEAKLFKCNRRPASE